MITITNGFKEDPNMYVKCCSPDGSCHEIDINNPLSASQIGDDVGYLTLQAFSKNNGNCTIKDSSIKISPLPNKHGIDVSYENEKKIWTIKPGSRSNHHKDWCKTNVNVEIGP